MLTKCYTLPIRFLLDHCTADVTRPFLAPTSCSHFPHFVYCELLRLKLSQVDSQYNPELKHSDLLYKPSNLGCNILQLHSSHISAPSSVTKLKLHLDVHCRQLGGQIPKYIRHCHRFHSLPSFTGITSEGRGNFCSGNPWNI